MMAYAMHVFMDLSPYIWVAVVALFLLATAAMLAYVAWWYMRNWFSPVTRVEARVLLKRSKSWEATVPASISDYDDPDFFGAEAHIGRNCQYIIVFAFDGRHEEFEVNESTFARAHEGDTGLLSFKGEKFICFVPDIRR